MRGGQPVVAEVVRSGFVEGRHHGAVAAVDPATPGDGVAWSVGDVHDPVLPRSCNKPVQAMAMVRLGLDLPPDLLALACASHSAEDAHLDGVRRILADAGLDVGALQCPPDWPVEDWRRDEVLRAGGVASRVLMNCSGKHAAMLATCVANGWPVDDYLDPDHPLQRAVAATFAEMAGVPVPHVAVDGCGAPLLGTTLAGLARAFSRLARGLDGRDLPDPAAERVTDAIRRHPEMVSGSRRDERALLAAIPGAIGKAGAEACYAVALPDGRALALKIEDGGTRARSVVMAAALARWGADDGEGVDADAVRRTGRCDLLGGGRVVGAVRAVLEPAP